MVSAILRAMAWGYVIARMRERSYWRGYADGADAIHRAFTNEIGDLDHG